MTHVAIKN